MSNELVKKTKIKEIIKGKSKRSSIKKEVPQEINSLFIKMLYALVKIDNRNIKPDSNKTFQEKHIHEALIELDETYSLTDLMRIETEEKEENAKGNVKLGSLMVGEEEIDLNLNLNIEIENK